MAEKELKIILIGESGVGKTSIILRYYKDVVLYGSGGDALLLIYKGILMENGSSFPNVELKPDLDQNISSTNIDPFNILL